MDACLTLDAAPSVKARLVRSGFRSADDLRDCQPAELAREAHIGVREAAAVLAQVQGKAAGAGGRPAPAAALRGAQSALQMLEREESRPNVVTFCRALDDILGGGVAVGELTEVCGVPGVGKTQLAMQLCASVQLPQRLGGVDGDAVYIDTEGSFMVERLEEMCEGVLEHFSKMSSRLDQEAQADADRITVDNMLSRVHYFRAYGHVELVATVAALPDFLASCARPVRLVVLDSVAFPFRHDFGGDFALRSRVLTGLAASLQRIADESGVAVVVVNQVTTKSGRATGEEQLVGGSDGTGTAARVVPALGETWAHCSTSRLTLAWDDLSPEPARVATLAKSPRLPARSARYAVTASGVRGSKRARSPSRVAACP